MTPTEFLRNRNIVAEDKSDLIIGFSNGTEESLIGLLDSYHQEKLKLLDLHIVSDSTSDEFGEIAYNKDIADTCEICKYLPQITKCKACDKCEEVADITRYYR